MGWDTDLLSGLAELLDTAGVADWATTGVYSDGQTGIYIAATPPKPDRAVCLTGYPVTEMVQLPDVTYAVQVRTRAGPDPRDVSDLDALIFDQFHGLAQVTFGAAHVVQMWRQSSAPMGRDSNDRIEWSSNYYLNAVRPTAHRPE